MWNWTNLLFFLFKTSITFFRDIFSKSAFSIECNISPDRGIALRAVKTNRLSANPTLQATRLG